MSEKKAGKRARKYFEKELNASTLKAEKNRAQLQKRNDALTIIQAKNKLTSELGKLKKLDQSIDVASIIQTVDGKNAKVILDADDADFSNIDSISKLLKSALSLSPECRTTMEEGNVRKYQKSDFPLKISDIEALNSALQDKGNPECANIDEEEISVEYQKQCLDLQIKNCSNILRKLATGKTSYPPGNIQKLIGDTEILLQKLMETYHYVGKTLLGANNEQEEKEVPPTEEKYFDQTCFEHYEYVDELEKHQKYSFSFPKEDDLISLYVPKATHIVAKHCRLFKWAVDNQQYFKVQFEERAALHKMIEKGDEAFKKLESLSQVASFLKPSYDKKWDPQYHEVNMMLHIIRDQFTRELKPTDTQLAEIDKMKAIETKRRNREKETDLEAMIKNMGYIDIQVALTRSKHRTARFYFFLIGYIECQCQILTKAYLYVKDVLLKQLEHLRISHEERCAMEPSTSQEPK